jgi:hypothetical protein
MLLYLADDERFWMLTNFVCSLNMIIISARMRARDIGLVRQLIREHCPWQHLLKNYGTDPSQTSVLCCQNVRHCCLIESCTNSSFSSRKRNFWAFQREVQQLLEEPCFNSLCRPSAFVMPPKRMFSGIFPDTSDLLWFWRKRSQEAEFTLR